MGGVSTGIFESLNIGMHRGDKPENVAENYRILGNALGFSLTDLVLTRQTHSDIVRVVNRSDCSGCFHRHYPECDALVTNTPGVALAAFTADCTPILLHDPVTGAVGAVHAGWRGTVADIAGNAVRAMAEHFGSRPENIRAAIGPNIAQCCFETDRDVPDAMIAALGEEARNFIRPNGEKYYVNLKAINALALRRAGVEQIENSPECTMCDPETFHSHRYTGGKRGAMGAAVGILA